MISLLKTLTQPRTLLIIMSVIGGIFLAYVLIAASIPQERPWAEGETSLLTGPMAAFEPADIARPVPEAVLTGAEGDIFLPSLVGGGEVTLVNLWASWCAPCIEELPSLVALSDMAGVKIVPIAMERRRDSQDRLLEKAGVAGAFPVITDPSLSLMKSYGGGDLVLPLTVVYDARGREVGRLSGAADWNSAEARRLMTAVLEGRARL